MKFSQKYFILMIFICLISVSWAKKTSETGAKEEQIVIDFNNEDEHKNWRIINDGVMGGISTSEIVPGDSGTLIFQGTVSLENNGGFASVRTDSRSFKFDSYAGIVLRVFGDGKKYQFRVRVNNRFDGISYRYIFDTRSEEWLTIQMPFSDFVPVYRGRIIDDAEPLPPDQIQQIGFLISDKQKGKFRLQIDWIKAYK